MPLLRSVLRCLLVLSAALALTVSVACAGAQTAVSIHDIMVTSPGIPGYTTYFLPDSYYLYSHYGQTVSVTGVVVGVEQSGDYTGSVYLSEPSGTCTTSSSTLCWDSYIASAEGLPVFNLKNLNAACAAVGANITVVGEVVESTSTVPADITAADTPGTGLLPTSCTVNSTNGTMTQSISLGSTLNSFGGALEYTGMTTSATFYAVSPSGSSKNAATGTVTSTGQFWATLSSNTGTNNHLFRSAGVAPDEYEPVSGVTTWAGNPQRILIDTTTFGGSPVDITVGQGIVCSTGKNITVGATAGIGLIDYTLGYARLLIFPTSTCAASGTVQAINSATSDSTHFHVGTLDLNGLGTTDADFATRLPKAVVAIATNLGQPDIVSLQEIADYATLSALATAVNAAAGTQYVPYLTPGPNAGALNIGFLVNKATVTVDSVNQLEANSSYTTTTGTTAPLWTQPPLVLRAEFVRSIGPSYPITVINELLTARDNSGDPTLGPDIRNHRAAQATDLSALAQSYESASKNVIVAGNLNAFEFSDGYVDVTGIVKGSPAASGTVTVYKPTSTTAPLTDFVASTTTSRYNYIERGDAVMYEHILASDTVLDSQTASASLASYETAITQPHFTTDYPAATYATTTTTAAGLTPHDGMVVAFLIPNAPTTATLSPSTLNYGNVELGASSSLSTTFTNTTTFAATVTPASYTIAGANAADYGITANTCTGTSLAMGSACTITVTFTPSAIGSRTATLTVTSNSTSNPSLSVSLIGNGINTTATLTPTTETFTSTYVGASSAAVVFTFTNTSSTVSETVGPPTVTGDYAITANSCTAAIAPGGACTLSVIFTPTAVGSRTGTLTVPNSSTGDPTLTAALGGTGLDTTATLTPTSAAFPDTGITATSAALTFTVTNTSAIAIKVNTPTITGDYAIASSTCSGVSLAASATCVMTVTFTPTAAGARTGTLTVTDSSTGDPTLTATLTGNGLNTTATISPTTATFVSTDVTGTSAAQTFTVTNTSPSSLPIKINAPTITGDFAISSTTCGGTLAAAATCTVTVTFSPTVVGTRTGALTVTNSSSADATLTAALTGTGLDTTATLTPTSFAFGSVYAGGGASAAEVFTVTNTSAVAIFIKSEAVSINFTYTTTCGTTLAAGATCTVSVVFAPTVSGSISGTLTVTNSTTLNPVLTAMLSGTGLPTTATLSPSSASYGNVVVGATSATQAFTWTNTSSIALTVSKVATTGDFSVLSTTCNGSVAANSKCVINVAFTPTALLARTGTLVVTSTASANGTLSAVLSGTGVADVQANASAVNFGNVDVGSTSSPQVLTITNYTNATISLTSINISGDYAYTTTCGSTIAGLSTCTVTLTFTPTVIGTRTGTLTINTNDTKYPVINVALTGNGVDFAVALAPTSGNVIAGRSVVSTATLTPRGGFNGNVTVNCTTNATGSVCTPAQTSLTLSTAMQMSVTMTTTAQYTVIGYGGFGGRWVWLALLSGSVLMLGFLRRRKLPRLLAALALLFVLVGGVTGCGDKAPDHNEDPTYPGTYTYTLTVTDGTLTHSATYALTVTSK